MSENNSKYNLIAPSPKTQLLPSGTILPSVQALRSYIIHMEIKLDALHLTLICKTLAASLQPTKPRRLLIQIIYYGLLQRTLLARCYHLLVNLDWSILIPSSSERSAPDLSTVLSPPSRPISL